MKKPICGFTAAICLTAAPSALASHFDHQGNLQFDSAALYTESFETSTPAGGTVATDPAALNGAKLLHVASGGFVELSTPIGAQDVSVRASVYVRGGQGLFVLSGDFSGPGVPHLDALLYPTGRVTSDGWVEMQSAPISLPLHRATALNFGAFNEATEDLEIDGVEVVPSGEYRGQKACHPPDASTCGPSDVCAMGYCIDESTYFPPIPEGEDRVNFPESIAQDLYGSFGGIATRKNGLPGAFASLLGMTVAPNASAYWRGLAAAVHRLHDSHSSSAVGFYSTQTLPMCFVLGDADLSHRQAPSDPRYPDVLISHGLAGQMGGLVPGDRLLAVNGMHPVAFVRSLVGLAQGNIQSSDPTEYEMNAEMLSYDIRSWATDITVVHCDPASGKCTSPYTIPVSSLPVVSTSAGLHCDNREGYHLASGNPDSTTHNLNNDVFYGPLAGTTADEALYGMIFDSLDPNPGPDPYAGPLADIQQNAKGVVIDHRTGNGGSFTYASEVSAPFMDENKLTVTWGTEPYYWDWDWTRADGLKEYDLLQDVNWFSVGSATPNPGLKAAVLLSRDVSASDFFAYGLHGTPNVRSFGTKSCGAFSTINALAYGGGALYFSMGDGESFTPDGTSLDGTGAEPDEYVVPRQSDLLVGKDTAYERALAWLRCTTNCDAPGGP
ncbi:MAG TPA: S41 family peptidase [Polyangiaceae bacterium]|jgi:hypothetical protein